MAHGNVLDISNWGDIISGFGKLELSIEKLCRSCMREELEMKEEEDVDLNGWLKICGSTVEISTSHEKFQN